MTYTLIIPGALPGLNEYIRAERGTKGKQKAATMKRKTENAIIKAIKNQLPEVNLLGGVVIHYTWVEKNKRRDKDNVAFAKKFIQDALVKTGVIPNDGWENIRDFTDSFALDPKNPRVEVKIEEAKDEKENKKSDAICF